MIRQYIELGHEDWHIFVYYGVSYSDTAEIAEELRNLNCPEDTISRTLRIISTGVNTGMTFSNTQFKTSLVCIGSAESPDQFVNTVVHEAKHIQSHICDYYNIDESGERAAYLIGYIVQQMYKILRQIRQR